MKGNPGGPGNPHGGRVNVLRAALLDAVTVDDLRAIVAKLVASAKGGDLASIRELLDRVLGKPASAIALDVAASDTLSGLTLDEQRERRTAIAERLGLRVVTMGELLGEVHGDPDYIEYLRQRALDRDSEELA